MNERRNIINKLH
jgi:hypothetical protein